jgi:dipeptide/tripeptide permease
MRLYPPGFLSLSASVACERFGFFLLASLLLLYLNERLGFTTAQATDMSSVASSLLPIYLRCLLVRLQTVG